MNAQQTFVLDVLRRVGVGCTAGAGAVLGPGRIVVVEVAGGKAGLVVVELRVLDHQMTAGVGARVALRGVLAVYVVQRDVAVRTSTDVIRRVVHVRGVVVGEQPVPRALGVGGVDAVARRRRAGVLEVRGGGRQIVAPPGAEAALGTGGCAAIPPDLVTAALIAVEEVADRQILDDHARSLVDQDAVASVWIAAGVIRTEVLRGVGAARARLRAVDPHRVAIHAAKPQARLLDQNPRARAIVAVGTARLQRAALVVIPRRDQDPVVRPGGVDGRLDV